MRHNSFRPYYDWIVENDSKGISVEVDIDELSNENLLFEEIKDVINLNKECENTDFWDIDIEDFESFKEENKPIKTLFDLCELFLLIDRLDMFTGFLVESKSTVKVVSTKTKILFLTANPKDEVHLGLEREVRKVMNTLNGATNRQGFELISEPAVGIPDITKAMQRKPEIVHFSGHGNIEGLAVVNDSGYSDLFPIEGLDRLFRLFKETTKCVILNACDSKELAATISKHGIHVVGMNDEIGDEAARKFAVGFYQSLGEGNNYEFAFEVGMVHISNEYDDANTPELWLNGERIKN